jgi:phosphatidylserine decarboxylase
VRLPIHREGWPFIAAAGVFNLVLFIAAPLAGWVFLPVTLWVVAFFRDPQRNPPPGDGLVSPADGRFLPVVRAAPPEELGLGPEPRLRLSIFMKASEHNERMSIRIRTDGARDVAVVQIAGLVARRIVCDLREGQTLCRGDRFGIIRFGSRLDIYLPDGARVLASAGQSVRAGETVLAEFRH